MPFDSDPFLLGVAQGPPIPAGEVAVAVVGVGHRRAPAGGYRHQPIAGGAIGIGAHAGLGLDIALASWVVSTLALASPAIRTVSSWWTSWVVHGIAGRRRRRHRGAGLRQTTQALVTVQPSVSKVAVLFFDLTTWKLAAGVSPWLLAIWAASGSHHPNARSHRLHTHCE